MKAVEDSAYEKENQRGNNKVGRLVVLWQDLTSRSTLHGLCYACSGTPLLRRVTWTILLLGATAYFCYLLVGSISKYNSYPLQTTITEEIPRDGVLFPAVSICSNNRYMRSKIDMRQSSRLFHGLGLDLSACEVTRHIRGNLTCGQALLCSLLHEYGTIAVNQCNETLQKHLRDALANATANQSLDPEQFQLRYGHGIDSLLGAQYCLFQNRDKCGTKDFVPSVTANGLCVTFNAAYRHGNLSKTRRVRWPGLKSGLTILLDTKIKENTKGLFSDGLRIVVHEPGEFINLDYGLNIFPGTHAAVMISTQKFTNLKAPYATNCTGHMDGLTVYSKSGCLALCVSRKVTHNCGCRPAGFPYVSKVRVCSIGDEMCEEDLFAMFNASTCSCNKACRETVYDVRVSYARFPDDFVVRYLKEKMRFNEPKQYYRENLVYLQVGLQRVSYAHHTQEPSFTLDNMLGSVGGLLGLFIGGSCLTAFEFVDFLFAVITVLLSTKTRS